MSKSIYVEVDLSDFDDEEIADACVSPSDSFIALMGKRGWSYLEQDTNVRTAFYRDRAIASLRAAKAIDRAVADFFFEVHAIALEESK